VTDCRLRMQKDNHVATHRLVLLSLVVAVSAASPESRAADAYAQEIQTWQQQRHKRLLSDEGWLVVSGLTWLKPGPNPFGSAPSNAVVLPAHSVPPSAGVLRLEGGRVFVEVAAGVKATLLVGPPPGASPDHKREQKPVTKAELRDDLPGPYDVLAIGDVHFFAIDRDGRMGIRVRDLRSPKRAEFKGLQYYPTSTSYRVTARFVPHPKPVEIKVPSVLGGTTPMASPGQLRFRLGNQDLSLDAVIEADDDKRLFVIFRDTTAGKETYGAGRFVYTDLPKDNQVVLDFNKAYTPPCAFTAFATCPLPPPQNRLKVAIEAGEKFSAHH
jgi:uncharacterized protein